MIWQQNYSKINSNSQLILFSLALFVMQTGTEFVLKSTGPRAVMYALMMLVTPCIAVITIHNGLKLEFPFDPVFIYYGVLLCSTVFLAIFFKRAAAEWSNWPNMITISEVSFGILLVNMWNVLISDLHRFLQSRNCLKQWRLNQNVEMESRWPITEKEKKDGKEEHAITLWWRLVKSIMSVCQWLLNSIGKIDSIFVCESLSAVNIFLLAYTGNMLI